jgi:F-type H+-transporting ATPase subunit delta
MQNPRLAGRYAKSLIGLAIEKNQLDQVYNDMLYLQSVCRESREFVVILRSPVITPDKKKAILESVTNGKVSEMVAGFNRLLILKGREASLPEIITAFIEQYKVIKEIFVVKLTTATEASESLKSTIVDKIRATTSLQNIELKTEVDPDIIGGFVLQIGDNLVDASISYDLNMIKQQFMSNDFVYKIR